MKDKDIKTVINENDLEKVTGGDVTSANIVGAAYPPISGHSAAGIGSGGGGGGGGAGGGSGAAMTNDHS